MPRRLPYGQGKAKETAKARFEAFLPCQATLLSTAMPAPRQHTIPPLQTALRYA